MAILLGGCTAQSGFKALDREVGVEDRLPDGITFQGTDVKAESARLRAAEKGVSYFAAKSDGTREACVVVVPDANPSLWVAGCGSMASGGEVVATVGAKRALHVRTGAAAVDLESAAVADAAGRHAVPFAALRAICDPANRTLPRAALLALDERGRIGVWRVAAAALARPGELPALFALAADAARARRALVGRVDAILRLDTLTGA